MGEKRLEVDHFKPGANGPRSVGARLRLRDEDIVGINE